MSPSAFVVHVATAPLRFPSSSSFCTRAPLSGALRPAVRYATLPRVTACLQPEASDAEQLSPPPQNGADPAQQQPAPEAVAPEVQAPETQPADAPETQAAAAAASPQHAEALEKPAPDSAAEPSPESASEQPQRRRRRRVRQRREVTLPLETMTVGMELEGVVKSVMEYGAFIGDTGAPTDGLLHVSQLGDGFIENVGDVVKVGDKLKVRVLGVDINKGNFSLTTKTAEELENKESKRGTGKEAAANRRRELNRKWDSFSYDDKAFVDAKVVSLTDFGAFCQLVNEDGTAQDAPTDGLIHISELSKERVSNVASILSVGQKVKVRVVSADRKRNRISLSMRDASANQNEQQQHNASAEDIAEAVKNQPEFKTAFQLAFEKAEATLSQ